MSNKGKTPLMLLFLVAMAPLPALAYIGPGAGITAVGALLALLAGIWYTLKGFLWLPLKRLFKKSPPPEQAPQADSETSAEKDGLKADDAK